MIRSFMLVTFFTSLFYLSLVNPQAIKASTLQGEDTCFTEVYFDQFFKTGGVIVSADTKFYKHFWLTDKDKFTPTINEIIETEEFIRSTLYMILAYTDYYLPILEEKLNSYHRQYAGYYNDQSDKIIVVNMHSFGPFKDDMRIYNSLINEWKCNYNNRYFDTRYQNHELYFDNPVQVSNHEFRINLTKKRLEKGGNGFLDEFWFLGKECTIYSDCE